MAYSPVAMFGSRILAPPTYVSGQNYLALTSQGTTTSNSLGINTLRVGPWAVCAPLSISVLWCDYSAAGDAGSTFRIGIWAADLAGGLPGTLVYDAGTVSVAGTPGAAEVAVSPSLSLQPGMYFIGGALQGGSSQATMRTVNYAVGQGGPLGTSSVANAGQFGFTKGSISGAFSNLSSPTYTSNVPRIGFKVA